MKVLFFCVCVVTCVSALPQYPIAYVYDNPWTFLTGRPKILKEVFGQEFDLKDMMVRCYYLENNPDLWLILDYSGQLDDAPAYIKVIHPMFSLYVVDTESPLWAPNVGALTKDDIAARDHLLRPLVVHKKPRRFYFMKVLNAL